MTAIIAGGTSGYMAIEGWSTWDALYMTVTTVTTVGFREVHPLSFAGQAFTLVLIAGGVGTAFYTATLLVTSVVEGELHRRFRDRRFIRMLDRIDHHFILCGHGRIGRIIAAELAHQGVPFVVIERNPAKVAAIIERGWLAIEADASREDVLQKAGLARARGLIAAVGSDAENVYTVLTARVARPDLFIIARVESDDAEDKLRRAGADRVISPYQIGASHMVQSALRPAVVDFIQLATSSGHLELSMEQVRVPDGSALAGKSLVDAELRQRYGLIVVSIKRAAGGMEFNPSSEALVQPGDELVVLGRPENVRALEEAVGQ
ncbi:MAG: potassium channel protein [Acidobacteria bacterium]|nr:potassium channel protein [Acidobacteriota bacterium]